MEDIKKIQEFFSKPLEEISTDNVAIKQQYLLTEPVQIAYTDSFGTGMTGAAGVLHRANVGYFIGEEDAYIIVLPGGTFYVSEDGEVAMKIYPIRDQSDEFGAALAKTPFAPKYEDWKDSLRKAPVKEADLNDPVAMKMRAAKDKLAKIRKANAGDDGNDPIFRDAAKLATLKKARKQLMRDMEQEAEPEGGPIANEYGSKLNRIDKAIAKLEGRKEMDYDTAVGKVDENKILKQAKLSSAEYQKVKKLKDFNKDNYKWNPGESLYIKLNEATPADDGIAAAGGGTPADQGRAADKTDGLTTKAMNKILMNVIKGLKEGEPGLWDNIRAKRARGEKPSSKNSKAYKSAVAAGKRINKGK